MSRFVYVFNEDSYHTLPYSPSPRVTKDRPSGQDQNISNSDTSSAKDQHDTPSNPLGRAQNDTPSYYLGSAKNDTPSYRLWMAGNDTPSYRLEMAHVGMCVCIGVRLSKPKHQRAQ